MIAVPTHSAHPLAGPTLAGPTPGYDPGANIVASEEVSLRIVGTSHPDGASPGERLRVDVQVRRPYQLFQSCDVLVVAKPSAFGRVLASATVSMSKWRSTTHCSGEAGLFFPLGFDPVGQPVVIEVYDAGTEASELDPDALLGYSTPFYLTDPTVYTVPASQDTIADDLSDVGAGIGGALVDSLDAAGDGLKYGLMAAVLAGGVYLTWPVLKGLRNTLED